MLIRPFALKGSALEQFSDLLLFILASSRADSLIDRTQTFTGIRKIKCFSPCRQWKNKAARRSANRHGTQSIVSSYHCHLRHHKEFFWGFFATAFWWIKGELKLFFFFMLCDTHFQVLFLLPDICLQTLVERPRSDLSTKQHI